MFQSGAPSNGQPGARTLASCVLVLTVALLAPPARSQEATSQIQSLARTNDLLKKQVDLASGDNFYLILDPSSSSLKFMLKGAVLQDYAVKGIEAGAQRAAYFSRGFPEGWQGRIWTGGVLSPPREQERVEIVAPPPSNDPNAEPPPPPVPPTPEEAYPVPHRYHVRFEGGLSLEFLRQGESEVTGGMWARLKARLSSWWSDVKAVLSRSSPESDEIRLRITLSAKDAESFYRALPPSVKLLVLPTS